MSKVRKDSNRLIGRLSVIKYESETTFFLKNALSLPDSTINNEIDLALGLKLFVELARRKIAFSPEVYKYMSHWIE